MRTCPRSILTALALGALLLPGPLAARPKNQLSVRVSQSFIPGAGYDALSANDHLAQGELAYGRELLELGRGRLWVEASWQAGAKSASLFGSFQTHTLLQSVTASAIYRLPILPWLVPRARVGLGVAIGSLELSSTGAGGSASHDRAAAFTGQVLLGLEFWIPRRRPRVNFGLVVEGGASFQTPLAFALEPEVDDELRRIPLAGSELGSVGLSGGQLRIGVMMEF